MCDNLNKITKITARPRPISILFIPAKIIKPIRIRLPKAVSNKLTNKSGTANMTNHNTTNKLNNPTNKFLFFSSFKEKFIYILYMYKNTIIIIITIL